MKVEKISENYIVIFTKEEYIAFKKFVKTHPHSFKKYILQNLIEDIDDKDAFCI